MTVRSASLIGAVAAVSVLGLTGCVSLFPKSEPAQLYRFGVAAGEAGTATSPARPYNVSRGTTVFNRAAVTDRILTVTGAQTAYVKDARWVAPASILFDEALTRTFEAAPGCARLITRGDPTVPDAILRVEVRTFEARYLDGEGTAPTAVVEARVTLINSRDRTVLEERSLRAEQKASDNRVSAIVEALDATSARVMTEVAGFTNANAARQGCGAGRPR